MIAGFLSFAMSKTGRWIVGAGIFLVIVWAWLMDQRRLLLKMERLRQERASRIAQDEVRKENDERLDQADSARISAPVGADNSGQLSERTRSILFGDN